jgi:hypothetical protein
LRVVRLLLQSVMELFMKVNDRFQLRFHGATSSTSPKFGTKTIYLS